MAEPDVSLDVVTVYNAQETDADKISTKLSDLAVSDLKDVNSTAASSPANITSTKIGLTASDDPEKIRHVIKQKLQDQLSCFIVVVTLEIIETDLFHEILKVFSSMKIARLLTVYFKVDNAKIPSALRNHVMLDYEARHFNTEFSKVVQGWKAQWFPEIPDPVTFRVPCSIIIEVHPLKGSSKSKNKAAEMKTIRETAHMIFNEPKYPISQVLLDIYQLMIRDVSQNPLKMIAKVKNEESWKSVQAACTDNSMGSLIMQHVLSAVEKDLRYELKLKAQREDEVRQDDAQKPANTILANVLLDMIKKKEYTSYDFYQKLLSNRDKMDLHCLRSDPEGFNPLHAIIVYNRLNFIMPLVHLKLFAVYMREAVPLTSTSSFRAHVPRQIAEAKKNKKFKDALAEHERLRHSMGKFLRACHDEDVALVRRMLHTQKELIREKDSMKNNCLYWAVVSDNLELFTFLLNNNAEYEHLNDNKESLLHVACMLGHKKFINILMTRCKLDPAALCGNKRTPLERVAENGDIECLKELQKHNVYLTSCVLPYAAANGRYPFVKYVLENTPTPPQVDSRDNTGRSALMKACETGRKEVVDFLLTKEASVTVEDLRRRTPLHVACENGHEDIVIELLKRGADINAYDCYTGAELCFLIRGKDKGRKAWHYVEVRRNVVSIFLQKTRAGQVDVAVYGTVVKSGWGEDPDKSLVEWVEKMFADRRTSSSSAYDLTPLNMAIYKQHPHIARILIEKGAEVNCKDYFGLTPLMMCALRNDKETAMLLEAKGAKLTDTDKEGCSALKIAEMNYQMDMVNYIKGKSFFTQTEDYLKNKLKQAESELKPEKLEELRAKGVDIRRHIIDTVRILTNSNNEFLIALGSGPIMKATATNDEVSPAAGGASVEHPGAVGGAAVADSGFVSTGNPNPDMTSVYRESYSSSMQSGSVHQENRSVSSMNHALSSQQQQQKQQSDQEQKN